MLGNRFQTGATRICGYQDCDQLTSRPGHPLCYEDYLNFQNDRIDECPNCPGVYKPVEYLVCRRCYRQGRQCRKDTRWQPGPQNADERWNEPYLESRAPAVMAVERVRRNMRQHDRECVNHESNTIQYLVDPILRGLGWEVDDPDQVIKEFKPMRKRRFGQAKAVDIALVEKGVPKAFLEVKRLDRNYDPDYMNQLAEYATYLNDGGIAVLTNGRLWFLCTVHSGRIKCRLTMDINDGPAETAAEMLDNIIGRIARCFLSRKPASPEAIIAKLKEYREQEAKRRNQPAYTIFKDETIGLIATHQPGNLPQLGNLKGVGPSTIEKHGAAIITIVSECDAEKILG